MSFSFYLVLATATILFVRWVLYELLESSDDGPSFIVFMLDRNSHPHDRFRALTSGLIVLAIILGYFVVE